MSIEDQELVRDFLIESNQNLSTFEQEMVELEQRPRDAQLLGSIFRTIHTIKGTCGFFGFEKLEKVTHTTENILSQLRAGDRDLTPDLVSLILRSVDAVKVELASIEANGSESQENHLDLLNLLHAAYAGGRAEEKTPAKAEVKLEASTTVAAPMPVEKPATPPPVAGLKTEAPQPLKPKDAAKPKAVAKPAPAQDDHANEGASKPSVVDTAIRVDVAVLERLMNLVGELVLVRNQILQTESTENESKRRSAVQRLNLLTSELQEGVMKTRMQPISTIWGKLPRVVRDVASSLGKQIQLETVGQETELDRGILEAIKDPLTHMVRNSCDHGIELPTRRMAAGKPPNGHLVLRAYHEGGQVILEIEDDGGGIDPERLRSSALEKGLLTPAQAASMSPRDCQMLIFMAGFSTAAEVTNISGRGVGMDVVKRNMERIGGTVEVQSRVGEGTLFKIRIPLTLAILPALLVASGGESFLIPQMNVYKLLQLPSQDGSDVEWVRGSPVYRYRGRLLPLVFLNKLLKLGPYKAEEGPANVVVLQADRLSFGVVVDRVVAMREIVVKPFGRELRGLAVYAGATILGDGRVSLILDIAGLARLSGLSPETEREQHKPETSNDGLRQTLLIFASGEHPRLAVPLTLIERLEKFKESDIERSGAQSMVQYRNQILPLYNLDSFFGGGGGFHKADPEEHLPTLVINQENRRIGLVVDRILDIQTDAVTSRSAATKDSLMGRVVFGGKVTDMINLPQILREIDPELLERATRAKHKGKKVVVGLKSKFASSAVKSYLELAGHHVTEAENTEQVLSAAKSGKIDLVMSSVELPPFGIEEMMTRLRSVQDFLDMPVVGLAADATQRLATAELHWENFTVVDQFDHKALLEALENMLEARHEQRQKAAELASAEVKA